MENYHAHPSKRVSHGVIVFVYLAYFNWLRMLNEMTFSSQSSWTGREKETHNFASQLYVYRYTHTNEMLTFEFSNLLNVFVPLVISQSFFLVSELRHIPRDESGCFFCAARFSRSFFSKPRFCVACVFLRMLRISQSERVSCVGMLFIRLKCNERNKRYSPENFGDR